MRESISKSRPSTPSPITHVLPFYHPPPLTYSFLPYSITLILPHCQTHWHTLSLSYSPTYSLTSILNHSNTPSLPYPITQSLPYSITHILPHYHIQALSYSLTIILYPLILPHNNTQSHTYFLTTIPNHSITTILDHSHTPSLSYPITLSFSYHNQSLATDQQIKQHMELRVQREIRPSNFRDF